jgi:CheY-like chemotaxis protein
MKILYTDDDEDTRLIFNYGLTAAGHEVHLAKDGAESVLAFGSHDFDLVIMDLEMPYMDGWETIRHIRQTEKGANIPIVVLTAYFMKYHHLKANRDNINLILSKPITPMLLAQMIEEMMWAAQQPQPDKNSVP